LLTSKKFATQNLTPCFEYLDILFSKMRRKRLGKLAAFTDPQGLSP
jgi:hypothetical protein